MTSDGGTKRVALRDGSFSSQKEPIPTSVERSERKTVASKAMPSLKTIDMMMRVTENAHPRRESSVRGPLEDALTGGLLGSRGMGALRVTVTQRIE